MKKLLLSIMLITALLPTVAAQDLIAGIRQRYAAAKEYVAEMMNPDGYPPRYYEALVTENLPGTGPHKESIKMFYGDKECEECEDEDGFDVAHHVHPIHWLRFVTAQYNYAALNYYDEYLFDENGKLEFIYAFEPYGLDQKDREYRCYFSNGKLLNFIVKARQTGSVEPYTEE